MRNLYLVIALLIAFQFQVFSQEVIDNDFETYETTPYYFRFGNRGSQNEYTYKPRWMYSHEVVDNPFVEQGNTSSKVLHYTSMEAKNYGLKFLFDSPIDINDVQRLSFKIYQPENVIGKPVETAYSSSPATQQNICIKLLSYFNTVIDFRQEDGILLYKDVKEFTVENEWVEFVFEFNKDDYASQLSKFKDGVLGVAILPTYDSGVTLKESNQYVCYIDDVAVNKSLTASEVVEENKLQIVYMDNELRINMPMEGKSAVVIYDMLGKALYAEQINYESEVSIPVRLDSGAYVVRVNQQDKSFTQKVIIEN